MAEMMVGTKVTPWQEYPYYGMVRYRIWTMVEANPSRTFQRHEWQHEDGTVELEDWIKSCAGHCVDSVAS